MLSANRTSDHIRIELGLRWQLGKEITVDVVKLDVASSQRDELNGCHFHYWCLQGGEKEK